MLYAKRAPRTAWGTGLRFRGILRPMHVQAIQTRLFRESEDLIAFIAEHVPSLESGSVLVVTSKIVALAEGRTVVPDGEDAKDRVIQSESDKAVKTKYVWLTVKDGMIMASAGIDESNADGKMILLPKDSFAAADMIRTALRQKYGIADLGVIVTDSHTQPLRAGVTGVALGYAGIKGIRDYRGSKDIFGREFKFSQVNVADSLAAAAVFTMGEGDEKKPLAVITDAPVSFTDAVDRAEVRIPLEDDMYLPFFDRLPKDFLR